ncbi:MAG TPA: hypothetical protein VMW08_00710 [Acidimicrobiales bacterium]|nr:hypothetical protein [Acidimicrobiales bacterium]
MADQYLDPDKTPVDFRKWLSEPDEDDCPWPIIDAALNEIDRLRDLLTDVLADNPDACDHPWDCDCSAAKAIRLLRLEGAEAPNREQRTENPGSRFNAPRGH